MSQKPFGKTPGDLPDFIEGYLRKHIEERHELEERLAEMRLYEPDVMRDALHLAHRQGRLKEVAQWLYWKYPHTNRILLKEYLLKFDLGAKSTNDFLVKGWGVVVKCPSCQKEQRLLLTSYTQWEDMQRKPRRPILGQYTCEECQARQSASWQAAAAQHAADWEANIEALRRLPYREYLQTEHWQQVRQRALRRAKYRCELCNSGTVMNVHHRSYAQLGYEDPKDLIVLCEPCHAKHHDVLPEVPGEDDGGAA
jgi:hypothetical protein